MKHVLAHLRANAVAYLALFVALGGTGYAATRLPAGSVGNRQIKNGSITPVKFDRQLISGSVRAWALVDADGHVVAGEGRPRVVVKAGTDSTGEYSVYWQVASFKRCAAIGGVTSSVNHDQPGFVVPAVLVPPASKSPWVSVQVFGATGQQADLPFYVALLC